MTQHIKITGCKDSRMWYAGSVGKVIPLIRQYAAGYCVVANDGYTNIVRFEDAEIVSSSETDNECR